jgi:hypothetical protein
MEHLRSAYGPLLTQLAAYAGNFVVATVWGALCYWPLRRAMQTRHSETWERLVWREETYAEWPVLNFIFGRDYLGDGLLRIWIWLARFGFLSTAALYITNLLYTDRLVGPR